VGDIPFPVKKTQIACGDRQVVLFSQAFEDGYLLRGDIPISSREADIPFGQEA
jgi:hypothetical protein